MRWRGQCSFLERSITLKTSICFRPKTYAYCDFRSDLWKPRGMERDALSIFSDELNLPGTTFH